MREYIKECSKKQEVNWFDIPKSCYVLINKLDGKENKVKLVKKLIDKYDRDTALNKNIIGIRISMKKGILPLKFPINLNQIEYIRLYTLMVSEGSFKQSLH